MLREFTLRILLQAGAWVSGLGLCSTAMAADLHLASPFTDHMVLQRGKAIAVWGTAAPGEKVEVALAGQKELATAAGDGAWQVSLKPLTAGGPYELTASAGGADAAAHDVLVGDVWLCSGQSNMQYSLGECADGTAVASVAHPKLRLGKVGTAWTQMPQTTAKIKWTEASPTEAEHFSAVAYTFAHELENDPAMKDVPIGVLEDCLGATVIESWLPKEGLVGFDPKSLQSSMFGIGPTLLYNGMIAPLGRSSFAGVIWYQGEGNAGEPERYSKFLPILFKTWRAQFEDPTLPVMVVQLPDYATDWGGVYWQWMREAQAKAVAATPNTSYVVTLNTNDGWNLHPQGKHEIGRRLALLARQNVYQEKVIGHGPVFKSARVDGSKIVVTFDVNGDQLTASAGPVDGFMIAGSDGVYHAANAIINGDSVNVSCLDVPVPATVRYAFTGVPHGTLTNESGIPAAPFRTDQQPVAKGLGEVQYEADGYVFKAKSYRVSISADGVITSLIVHNQQLISNAPDQWGGARVMKRNFGQAKVINTQQLAFSNNETSLTIICEDDKIRLIVSNKHPKEEAAFHIAFNPSVSVSGSEGGLQLAKRKSGELEVTSVDRVMQYKDVAADDGKVFDTTIPTGQTKTIELKIVGK